MIIAKPGNIVCRGGVGANSIPVTSRDTDLISGFSFLSAACLSFACLSADRDADRFRHRQGGIMGCVLGIHEASRLSSLQVRHSEK